MTWWPKLRFNKSVQPNTRKEVNVGFILDNMAAMTIKEIAEGLSVSQTKIRATIKEYNISYPKKNPMHTTDIVCSKCKKSKQRKDFYKNTYGLMQPCIPCKKEQVKERKQRQSSNIDFLMKPPKY